jgi:hypothetical protein
MAVEKNLIQVQSELQSPSVRDEDLIKYANGSSASVPAFLALMEMSRRKQLEEGSKAYDASNQKSIKDQLASALTAPTQTRDTLTGPPSGQVDPTAAPTGISVGAAPANQANPTLPPSSQDNAVAAAEGGLMSLPINHFNASSYAGGGIVAFAEGDLVSEENQLSSFPKERKPSPQSMSEAGILQALQPAAEPIAPAQPSKGFQSILESLPKVQANTMPAPQELTREQIYENMKENRRLAGVSEDPYAEANKRQAAIEARQKAGYEQQGLDRLLAQLSAFAKADPAKGIGYAGAVSAEASQALEAQQNALRDKQEQVQLEYARNMAKEEDARRRGDATGIQAAQEAQKKDKYEYAKLQQEDQKLQGQQLTTAAHIYNSELDAESARRQTEEYAKARRDAAERAAESKPSAEDKKLLKVQTTVNANPVVKAIADSIKQGTIQMGTDEYYQALRKINEIARPLYKQAGLPEPEDVSGDIIEGPAKKPGFFSELGSALVDRVKGSNNPGKTVSFDQLPK